MSEFSCIKFSVAGRVARITLDRPDAANGLDNALAAELAAAAARCDGDASVKAVILTGAGRFFCAGGDLKAMARHKDNPQYLKRVADDLHRAISTFSRMEAPLIIAVNGVAAGAGFSMAIAGDLVVAAQSSSFTMAYTRAGLSPDGSSSYFLPRLVGLRKAQELMLTNRTLSATEARDWGLVNEVVPDGQVQARADELAAGFVAGARQSNAIVKRLLLDSFGNGLEQQMEIEGRLITQCVGSRDGQEGIAAFLEKRPARFD